jgi:hypothetical protein
MASRTEGTNPPNRERWVAGSREAEGHGAMSTSWYVLPTGRLMTLTTTQDLLVDLAPVVEDMSIACQQLQCVVAESIQTRDEARRLIIRSRRQRLGLELVTEGGATGEPGKTR